MNPAVTIQAAHFKMHTMNIKMTLLSLKRRFIALARWQQVSLLLVALWLLNGLLFGSNEEASKTPQGVRLVVEERSAQPHQRTIVLYGSTQPVRDVALGAQASGQVAKIVAKEGSAIKRGDVILQIDVRDNPQRLSQAKAQLRQTEIEYEAARKLQKSGFESKVKLAQSKTALESARARLKQTQLEAGFLELTAPFDGLLESINVKEGDFVGIGTFGVEGAAARMVDVHPLLVKGRLAERDAGLVNMGEPAQAQLAGGRLIDGLVHYVGNVADSQNRTFAVEIELPNLEGTLPVGVTAEMHLKTAPQMAYSVPASVLGLNDAGEVGIKYLDSENRVQFAPIHIIEESADALWVTGLPEQVRLITLGHAYVSAGQIIEAQRIEMRPTPATSTQE